MASGGPGGGDEPPGRRHGGGEILAGRRRDVSERPIENPPFWVAFDYASCDALTGLGLSSSTGGAGAMASAQLSQYAASPIRYGHPLEIVADLLGSTKLRADASVPKTTTSTDSGTKQQS